MSRRGSPRRQDLAFLGLFLLAFLGLAAPAAADDPAARGRGSSASTVVGSPNAVACSEYAGLGRSDDDALKACNVALSSENLKKKNQVITLINRGAMHMRRNDAASALADFDLAIEKDPKNGEAFVNRGAALVMAGKPGPAVAAITQALSFGVAAPYKAYFNRGAAREALGDLRGAYEDYTTALEIQPDWGPAEQELARFVKNRREQLAGRLNEAAAPRAQN